MLDPTDDMQPLSRLMEHPDAVVAQVRRTGKPVTLTVEGKPDIVVMDAADYEALQGDWSLDESVRDLQQGIDEIETGLGRPAREVLAEISARHGL